MANETNNVEVYDSTVPTAREEANDLFNDDGIAVLIDRAERTEDLSGVPFAVLRKVIAEAEARNVSDAAKAHLLSWAERANNAELGTSPTKA